MPDDPTAALRHYLVGVVGAPHTYAVTRAGVLAFAAATGDDNPAYRDGDAVPPVFAVAPAWSAMIACAHEVVPADALLSILHGRQDIRLIQPMGQGSTLTTTAELIGTRAGRAGARLVIRARSYDENGELVVDQLNTSTVCAIQPGEDHGADAPGHRFAPLSTGRPLGRRTVHVTDDQPRRYSEASGDVITIHLDDEAARSVGLPGIILQGLCTFAIASRAAVELGAGRDPRAVRRIAARFTGMVFPGEDVTTTVHPRSTGSCAFESHVAGRLVLGDGLVEHGPANRATSAG